MNIGDIHWVDLPGAGGRAQFGRRPAMVIQDEKYGGNLPTVIVVPLTSTQKALRFAGTTAIVATPESGLRNDSVALVFQCLAVDRSQVGQRVGNALQQPLGHSTLVGGFIHPARCCGPRGQDASL